MSLAVAEQAAAASTAVAAAAAAAATVGLQGGQFFLGGAMFCLFVVANAMVVVANGPRVMRP